MLHPLTINALIQVVLIDFIEPLDVTKHRFIYICSVVDAPTWYAKMKPTHTYIVVSAIQVLKESWLPCWAAVQVLVADVAQAFGSRQWLQFCQEAGIRSVQVPPYLQRANGINERLTQTVINLLRRSLLTHKEWCDGLSQIVSIYKNLPHADKKMSPNYDLLV